MGRLARIAFAASAVWIAVAEIGNAAPGAANGVMCGTQSPLRGMQTSPCDTLAELQEPVGLRLRNPADTAVYRLLFTAGISIHGPLLVRIELYSPRQGLITIRTLTNGHAVNTRTAPLGAEDIKPLLDAAERSKFWDLPVIADSTTAQASSPAPQAICLDGQPMVIEGLDRARYHVAFGECTLDEGLVLFERAIASLAKHRFPDIHDPWMPIPNP
jgi:hypothetical protein